jgi:hypothetical protein
MENQIIYKFERGQKATRFLNYLKAGEVEGVKASLCQGGHAVKTRYSLERNQGFDSTCQQLDDLASGLGGVEVE